MAAHSPHVLEGRLQGSWSVVSAKKLHSTRVFKLTHLHHVMAILQADDLQVRLRTLIKGKTNATVLGTEDARQPPHKQGRRRPSGC